MLRRASAFLVVLAVIAAMPVCAAAQSTLTSSTISTAGADCSVATRCADFDTSGVPAFALYLNVGTSGTFNWEASVDATSLTSGIWFDVTDDVNGTSSTTADGVKYFTNPGYRRFRVRASAISGDATVVAFRGASGARASVASIAAGSNLIGEVQVEGESKSFAQQTATGQTAAFVPATVVQNHSIQLVTGGTVVTCTYRLQGSNDGGITWFDISASDITCTSNTVSFESNKPALRVRGNLLTFTGTSPTINLHYAGR